MKLTLEGQVLSTNHIYPISCAGKYPRKYMTAKGRALKEDYQWQVKSQYKGETLKERLAMTIRIFFGNKRRGDLDNYNKILIDSMEGVVFENDNQIDDLRIIRDYDKKRPRAEVEITKL